MKAGRWATVPMLALAASCVQVPHQSTPPSKPSRSETSIRAGVVNGTADVTGRDAIPDNDTEMVFLAIEHWDAEAGAGVGFRGSALGDTWSLTEDNPSAQPDYSSISFYPHFTALMKNELLHVPWRFGPEVRVHDVDQRIGPIGETSYRSYGLGTELEPEWKFVDRDHLTASIYGRMHLGAGIGTIDNPLYDDTQLTINFAGELGIRLQASVVSIGIGILGEETRFAQTRNEVGGHNPEASLRFTGAFFSFGVVF